MKKGAVVIFESTVYPGVTEDICVPILAVVPVPALVPPILVRIRPLC